MSSAPTTPRSQYGPPPPGSGLPEEHPLVLDDPETSVQPPSYFRGFDDMLADARHLAETHPHIVTYSEFGQSWQTLVKHANRPLFALELTAVVAGNDAPTVLHVSGVHGRELAPPAMLMEYARRLVDGYGVDPAMTEMLDTRRIVLAPMVNPDGYAIVEVGYDAGLIPVTLHRKNAAWYFGTDLNRNFNFQWKPYPLPPGARTEDPPAEGVPPNIGVPSAETFSGYVAASEPETRAIQDLLGDLKPDLFVDWHAHSADVIYPWGYTDEDPPDADGLARLAAGVAERLGVPSGQMGKRTVATGTTIDYAYGEHGIPSLAIELPAEAFKTTDERYAHVLEVGIPALDYLNDVAGYPA